MKSFNLKEYIDQYQKQVSICEDTREKLKGLPSDISWNEICKHSDAPEWAFWYAYHVLERPWPEAEPFIMGSPEWAYFYACDVLKCSWPEAVQVLTGSADWAFL